MDVRLASMAQASLDQCYQRDHLSGENDDYFRFRSIHQAGSGSASAELFVR